MMNYLLQVATKVWKSVSYINKGSTNHMTHDIILKELDKHTCLKSL